MKSMVAIVGIILIVAGLASLSYEGFTYRTREKVASVNLANVAKFEVTEEKEKRIPISPILGSLSVAVGIILVVVARTKRP